jgi:hypothetical protein
MDISLSNAPEGHVLMGGERVSTAKLHVLRLSALRAHLGAKWDRLSSLVHRLFDAAMRESLGPRDRSLELDELTYAIIFYDLSPDDAARICIAIATKVCRALFGERIDGDAIRRIIARVAISEAAEWSAEEIDAFIEAQSRALSATLGPRAAAPETPAAPHIPLTPADRIRNTQAMFARMNVRTGFFPVWDLARGRSTTLFLSPQVERNGTLASSRCRSIAGLSDQDAAILETALLDAVSAYSARVRAAGKICALGVGVSYATLSVFQSRIAYLTALQKLRPQSLTPVLLKIENIPEGTPLGRLADLVGMLRAARVKVLLEFQSLLSVEKIDIALGAIGLGGSIPAGADAALIQRLLERTARNAAQARMFAFVDRIDSARLLELARRAGIKFGTGTIFLDRLYSGVEDVPEFPLELLGM